MTHNKHILIVEDEHKIAALLRDYLEKSNLGADDYICKPFSPREVVARVKAVLRRANTESNELGSINSISGSISL